MKLRAKIISYFNSRQTCYLSNMTCYIHFGKCFCRNENCYFHIIYINVEILTILSNFWHGEKEKCMEMHSFSATLQNQLFSVLSDRFQSLQKFLTSQKIELPTFSKTCTYIPTFECRELNTIKSISRFGYFLRKVSAFLKEEWILLILHKSTFHHICQDSRSTEGWKNNSRTKATITNIIYLQKSYHKSFFFKDDFQSVSEKKIRV